MTSETKNITTSPPSYDFGFRSSAICDPVRVRVGPSVRAHLPGFAAVLALLALFAAPSGAATRFVVRARPDLTLLEDRVLSWRTPLPADELRGLHLLYDTPVPGGPTLAVVRSAVRANHRLDPFDALVIATHAVAMARRHHLDYGFFCATLLQESAFDPGARSAAGAIGIGQFTLDTAADEGVDPFDWRDAVRGSATLLGRYVRTYDGIYPDPYAAALAAYNAGPGTVAYYHGVPPYAETRDYISDIDDRWARIVRDVGRRARRAR